MWNTVWLGGKALGVEYEGFPLGSMRRDAKTEPLANRIISLSPQRSLLGKVLFLRKMTLTKWYHVTQ